MVTKKRTSIDDHFTFERAGNITALDGRYLKNADFYKCNDCGQVIIGYYRRDHYNLLHKQKPYPSRTYQTK